MTWISTKFIKMDQYNCKTLPFTYLNVYGHETFDKDMWSESNALPITKLPVTFPINLENQTPSVKIKITELKSFLSRHSDELFAIPIVYSPYPSSNNVGSWLKEFSSNYLLKFKNVHLVFYNGSDLYGDRNNFDREQYIADSLIHFPKDRIHFYLCNVELLNLLNSKMPGVNLNFFNIYFSQIADTNTEIKNLKYKTEQRKYNVISLNSRIAKHRDDIVSVLENYDTALYSYRYRGKFLENTKWDNDLRKYVGNHHEYYQPQPHSLMRQHQNIIPDSIYNNAYFYICTETDFYNEYVGKETNYKFKTKKTLSWFTEKTLKSFVYKWPMIIVGNPYTLQALRNIGFKTFPILFDEGYDIIEDPESRMLHIKKEITKLCEMPTTKAHQLYHSDAVQETLEHNRNHFFKLLDTMDINKISKTLQSQYRV